MVKKMRIISAALAAVLAAASLTGCGTSGNSTATSADTSKSESTDTSAASDEKDSKEVSLTVLCGYAGEDPHGKYVYSYADEFMKEHPNIKVEIQAISTNDIYTKLSAMATTPDDLPQIFFTSADAVATLHDLELTKDLTNLLPDDLTAEFANGVLDSCKLGDEIAYFPVALQPQAIIYRKDRFKEAGLEIPKTWDEFVECAKALTKDTDGDGEVDQWGFGMVGSNNSSGQSRFMSYLWSNGVDCVTDTDGKWDTDLKADNKTFTDAFEKWTKMNDDGIVPIGITEVDYPTAANYFAMGYTSMFMTGSNALGVAYANNPDLKGNLGSFKLPGDYPGTMLGTEGYAISEYTTDEEAAAAVEFLRFFVEHDDQMMFWQSSGKIPATVDGQKAEYITGDDYAGYLQQIEDGCRPTVSFAGISGLKSALGDAYAAVFSNEKNTEEAMADLEKTVDELMEDYN